MAIATIRLELTNDLQNLLENVMSTASEVLEAGRSQEDIEEYAQGALQRLYNQAITALTSLRAPYGQSTTTSNLSATDNENRIREEITQEMRETFWKISNDAKALVQEKKEQIDLDNEKAKYISTVDSAIETFKDALRRIGISPV